MKEGNCPYCGHLIKGIFPDPAHEILCPKCGGWFYENDFKKGNKNAL